MGIEESKVNENKEKRMDKIREDGLATKKEVLLKINELVERNNQQEKDNDYFQRKIDGLVRRYGELDNRLEEYVKEIRKHLRVIIDKIYAIK